MSLGKQKHLWLKVENDTNASFNNWQDTHKKDFHTNGDILNKPTVNKDYRQHNKEPSVFQTDETNVRVRLK